MTGSEATPRPWHRMGKRLETTHYSERSIAVFDDENTAELALRAVNTFSEREALLRESLNFQLRYKLLMQELEFTDERMQPTTDFIARIRTALGETAAGEKERTP